MIKRNGVHAAQLQEYAGEKAMATCAVSRCSTVPSVPSGVRAKKGMVTLCLAHQTDWEHSPERKAQRPTSFVDWLNRTEAEERNR